MVLCLFDLTACNRNEDLPGSPPLSGNSDTWLIPVDRVLDGGPGKDGIPAISNPKFSKAFTTSYLSNKDLVVGVTINGSQKAYPHVILDWHEIVNDQIDDIPIAITYCPLTGTAITWNRDINGTITEFGVSGLLYNSNLIPYDRQTDSNWSQMRMDCVNGPLIGEQVSTFQVVETTWKNWKQMFPNSEVMTLETGFNRNYGRYPYVTSNGDYRVEDYLIFPVGNVDDRLSEKERVHGILENEEVRVYRFSEFDPPDIITDIIGGKNIAVVGSSKDNFMVSFEIEDQELTIEQSGETIFKDQKGNLYNIFGEVIEGPDSGSSLIPTRSFIGYWFSWAAFYPEVEIYTETQ